MSTDTIAAIATAMNNAGISIIRISGSKALNIIDKIYKSKKGVKKLSSAKTYTAHYGYIVDNNEIIDEVIVLIIKAPNSYTTEDIVEIDCHGGIVVTKKVLETVIKYGARPAEPGEFTKRAFLNGRIDLSQAEAVIDVINSKNEYALKSSIRQLNGNILEKINFIRKNIIEDIAFIEAALDDPEHINLDNFSQKLEKNVKSNIIELKKLLDNSDNGRILKEGIKTVIVGKPNAGKSSLLNTLLGEERAIVTNVAGTTRDTLEEQINLNGIQLNIIDTAGIRKTEDTIEKIGVEKSIKMIDDADLIIYVVDASTNLDDNDENIIKYIKNKNVIVLLNKTDLDIVVSKKDLEERINERTILISAKENIGINLLEERIKEMFFKGKLDFNDEIYITNIRHKHAILQSINSLKTVQQSIDDNMPEDFFSIDLMEAYKTLGTIIGETVEDDLVDTIFSKFCMGK